MERLRLRLGLITIGERKARAGMTEIFKILRVLKNIDPCMFFRFVEMNDLTQVKARGLS